MKHVGHVSGEGGPLLLADAHLLVGWRGTEEGGADYARAASLFDEQDPEPDGVEIPLGAGHGVLWEMHGAGTTDVFREDDDVYLVRSWLDDESALPDLAEAEPFEQTRLGAIDVRSGALAILWAAESAICLDPESVAHGGRPGFATSIDGAALILRVPPGRYAFFHDEVELPGGFARRCRVTRV